MDSYAAALKAIVLESRSQVEQGLRAAGRAGGVEPGQPLVGVAACHTVLSTTLGLSLNDSTLLLRGCGRDDGEGDEGGGEGEGGGGVVSVGGNSATGGRRGAQQAGRFVHDAFDYLSWLDGMERDLENFENFDAGPADDPGVRTYGLDSLDGGAGGGVGVGVGGLGGDGVRDRDRDGDEDGGMDWFSFQQDDMRAAVTAGVASVAGVAGVAGAEGAGAAGDSQHDQHEHLHQSRTGDSERTFAVDDLYTATEGGRAHFSEVSTPHRDPPPPPSPPLLPSSAASIGMLGGEAGGGGRTVRIHRSGSIDITHAGAAVGAAVTATAAGRGNSVRRRRGGVGGGGDGGDGGEGGYEYAHEPPPYGKNIEGEGNETGFSLKESETAARGDNYDYNYDYDYDLDVLDSRAGHNSASPLTAAAAVAAAEAATAAVKSYAASPPEASPESPVSGGGGGTEGGIGGGNGSMVGGFEAEGGGRGGRGGQGGLGGLGLHDVFAAASATVAVDERAADDSVAASLMVASELGLITDAMAPDVSLSLSKSPPLRRVVKGLANSLRGEQASNRTRRAQAAALEELVGQSVARVSEVETEKEAMVGALTHRMEETLLSKRETDRRLARVAQENLTLRSLSDSIEGRAAAESSARGLMLGQLRATSEALQEDVQVSLARDVCCVCVLRFVCWGCSKRKPWR